MNERSLYEPVIGLEVHVELSTKTKMFCRCSTKFGAEPNTQVCPICLGMPGVLPVVNKAAVEYAIKAALALHCRIAPLSRFDRKNYFYPDLPKNYQISQYALPLATGGYIDIVVDGEEKRIGIKRLHLEEDAGKLLHEGPGAADRWSLVDFNRTGVPLIEIVSEPDIRSPEEARLYLTQLKAILEYLEVSDCRMEQGSLRCDANISVRKKGVDRLGTRTELKNLNSFKALYKALEYEIDRQIGLLERGEEVVQETRAWDEAGSKTVVLRGKEEAHDYRYFPDPDLPPLEVASWAREIAGSLPELPAEKARRFVEEMGLPRYDANVLTSSKPLAEYFEACVEEYVSACGGQRAERAKTVSNWMMGEMLRYLNARGLEIGQVKLGPRGLARLLALIDRGDISGKIAKALFDELCDTGADPKELVQRKGMGQITDASEVRALVEKAIAENPKVVADLLAGKEKAATFLVGQVMKYSCGRANPKLVNDLIAERIDALRRAPQ